MSLKTSESDEQPTPIDRPLLRSDLNEVRDIVFRISERQLLSLRQQEASNVAFSALAQRVSVMERRFWLPTVVSATLAALALLSRLA